MRKLTQKEFEVIETELIGKSYWHYPKFGQLFHGMKKFTVTKVLQTVQHNDCFSNYSVDLESKNNNDEAYSIRIGSTEFENDYKPYTSEKLGWVQWRKECQEDVNKLKITICNLEATIKQCDEIISKLEAN
jgi:hypothetical protein